MFVGTLTTDVLVSGSTSTSNLIHTFVLLSLRKTCIDSSLCLSENYTCIGMDMNLHRNTGYYFIQIYVPTGLIVVLSWSNFWLNVEAIPARISLGLLTVLTMTTSSSSADNDLQRVSYVKALDIWIFVCLFFVFAAFLEYAWVNVTLRVELRRKSEVTEPTDLQKSKAEKMKAFTVEYSEPIRSARKWRNRHRKRSWKPITEIVPSR